MSQPYWYSLQKHTHTHTFAANFKEPANHWKPMHGSVDQVKDLCDRSCHVTSKKANVIRSISCLYFFSGSLLSSGQSPRFLIWLSMSFTSTESYLVIPLSLVFFSYLPTYHPAWPHIQTHWAAASFCIHHALLCLCKCQVSSWSFFPPRPISPPFYRLFQAQALSPFWSQLKTGLHAPFVYFHNILYLSLLKPGCPCFGITRP